MKDHLVKAIADGVRIHGAITTELVNEAISRHDCWPVAAAALGRTMTGAVLLAANLKNDEAITINIRGNGPLGSVTADASADGYVRGYVGDPHVDIPLNSLGKLDIGGAVGSGLITVTRFTGLKGPVSGSCELVSGEIAEDITQYLYSSEQTASSVGLGVLVGHEMSVAGAGGFIVQLMPDATDDTIGKLEDNIKKMRSVSNMLSDGFSAKDIISETMKDFEVEFLSTTDLSFKCQCSRQRIEDVLIGLNIDDLKSLLDDGKAEVCCHFCGEKYQFSKGELEHIYKIVKGVTQ